MSTSEYKSFAVVIVSTQVELDSIMKTFSWKPMLLEGDAQQYYEFFSAASDGEPVFIVAAKNDEMSNVASATLATKMIDRFHPRYVILVGVAAGVRFAHKEEQPAIGDVVVADRVWTFSAGKYVSSSDSPLHTEDIGFLPRPQVHNMNEQLREFIKKRIIQSRLKYKIHLGALASGYSVVANRHIVERYVIPVVEKTKGLDMESYGVFYAVEHATEPRPVALVVKGICDFADENKNDDYQKIAADNSCDFINYLMGEILLKFKSQK